MYYRLAKKGVDERVERGAQLLDRKRPRWFQEVDPSSLEINDIEKCILGQLYGNYHEGVRATCRRPLFVPNLVPAEHGFVATCEFRRDIDKEFALLDQKWVEAIERRRAAIEAKAA